MFNKLFIILFILIGGCDPLAMSQQVQVSRDELPNTNSTDSTAVLNNVLRQNQNAINSIGGYFNSNQYLTEANGGTGANLSAAPNGSILVQDSANVGIGTFGQGTSGQVLISNGAGANPSFASFPHGIQLFTTSGSFTAPAGITVVYITEVGGGGGGGQGSGVGTSYGGGGGAGKTIFNYPFTVTPGNTYTVTVGAGGIGGTGGPTQGGDGAASSFDSLTADFGRGGQVVTGGLGPGGLDGSGSTAGVFGIKGGNGGTASGSISGGGGATPFGSGATGGGNSAAANTGAGGGGYITGLGNGGAGGSGLVIVQY